MKNSLCQNSDFLDRSIYFFFAKFLKILTTGSLEIDTFLLKQSGSIKRETILKTTDTVKNITNDG